MDLNWSFLTFSQLSNTLLYKILKLRAEVFIIEQQSLYLDIDEKDEKAIHLICTQNDELVAYSRIFANDNNALSIGRLVINPSYRKKGIGNQIMRKSMEYIWDKFSNGTIEISAQSYLQKFYQNLGFKTISKEYIWDGVPHIDMSAKSF